MDNRRVMRILVLSNFVLMFGFQVWRTVFNNLAVDDLGLQAGAVGAIQSIRELPGLMGFLFVLMVSLLGSELRVMGANILLLGMGLVFTGLAQGLVAVVLGTLVTSIGFHYFSSGSQAVLLQATSRAETPRALGNLSSIGALASVLATIGVSAAALMMGNRQIMVVGGIIVMIAGAALLPRMNAKQRFVKEEIPARETVRRRYWLFYVLTFLMGTRRHIFTTFAIFLLVSVHGLETWQTAALFLINSVVSFLALPQFGRMIAMFGERRTLTVNFVLLILIFLGYATVESTLVLVVLFVVDNLLFGFSLAINSYFQKIAMARQDITPNMSLGQSINHVAAVIIPIVGGLLWEAFDPAVPFISGAVIAVVSLALLQWMRIPAREPAWEPAV
jgi:predicted MFS family arabinose efflux permease